MLLWFWRCQAPRRDSTFAWGNRNIMSTIWRISSKKNHLVPWQIWIHRIHTGTDDKRFHKLAKNNIFVVEDLDDHGLQSVSSCCSLLLHPYLLVPQESCDARTWQTSWRTSQEAKKKEPRNLHLQHDRVASGSHFHICSKNSDFIEFSCSWNIFQTFIAGIFMRGSLSYVAKIIYMLITCGLSPIIYILNWTSV